MGKHKLLSILSLLFILILGGCSKPSVNTVTDFKMSSTDVYIFFQTIKIFPQNTLVADSSYALPSKSWIENEFSNAFKIFKNELQASNWSTSSNDCDDFARFAAFFAQYLHHNTQNKLQQTALAFGEFMYVKDPSSPHAINVFLYRENNAVNIGFYEPQINAIVSLSQKEIKSAFFLRI